MSTFIRRLGFTHRHITHVELKTSIDQKLVAKKDPHDFILRMADTKYLLLPLSVVKNFLRKSNVDRLDWDPSGAFDCDDFALVLKAQFSRKAYKARLRGALCFGIVWGMLPYPFPHALNWMINDDDELRFIEPQTDEIIDSSHSDWVKYQNIWLMLI